MSDRITRLKKLLEFDVAWARRDLKRALIEADVGRKLSQEQIHHLVMLNINSAEWENARLKPLITAMLECVSMLEEFYADKDNYCARVTAFDPTANFLACHRDVEKPAHEVLTKLDEALAAAGKE